MSATTGQASSYVNLIRNLLAGYFDKFPLDKPRLQVLCDQVYTGNAELCSRLTLPGHLTGSALVLNLEESTALLIRHKFLQRWLQPGGHLDVGEHPVDGALRELREESGITAVRLHPWHQDMQLPLDIDSHVIPANAAKAEPEHLHHDWLYLFTLNGSARVALQEDEVSHFNWFPIDNLGGGEYGKRLARVHEKLTQLRLLNSTGSVND